ncbi:hypothetical protein DRO26_00405 [Candidatus Bathyarchaeota archaeon]|nr:MAG: hypothetical protein DRO26_00405 [Candidatus Bathyarchaeota archaeon]
MKKLDVLAFLDAVVVFLVLVKIINFLHIEWYLPIFPRPYLGIIFISLTGNPQTDQILSWILAFSVLPITSFLTIKKPSLTREILEKVCISLLLILITTEILALLRWVTHPFWPSEENWTWHFVKIENQLFYAWTPICPILFMVAVYIWLLKPLTKVLERTGKKIFKTFSKMERWVNSVRTDEIKIPFTRHPKVLLFASMLLTVVLALYPYHPNLNPLGRFVGVDVRYYFEWLGGMVGKPFPEALSYAFWEASNGSRPLYLLLLYTVKTTTSLSVSDVAKFELVVLAPLLVLAVYLFVKEGTGNDNYAALAALFTAFSYNITVGVFAAFYANICALILGFLFLTLLLKYMKNFSWKTLTILTILLATIIFIHPWTWSEFVTIIITYLLIILVWEKNLGEFKKKIVPLGFILVVNLLVDIVKSWVLKSLGGIQGGYEVASTSLGLNELTKLWLNLQVNFVNFSSGFYMNPIILMLTIFGVLILTYRKKDEYTRILLAWVIVTSIPLPFSNYVAHCRLVFNLPFHILSVNTLVYLCALTQKEENSRIWFMVKLLTFLIILLNLTYAFRSVINTI